MHKQRYHIAFSSESPALTLLFANTFTYIFLKIYFGVIMLSKSLIKRSLLVCSILCLSFLTGIGAARLKELYFPETVTTSSEGNWGLSFQEEGEPPVANATYD